jgi:hypothetical protein
MRLENGSLTLFLVTQSSCTKVPVGSQGFYIDRSREALRQIGGSLQPFGALLSAVKHAVTHEAGELVHRAEIHSSNRAQGHRESVHAAFKRLGDQMA